MIPYKYNKKPNNKFDLYNNILISDYSFGDVYDIPDLDDVQDNVDDDVTENGDTNATHTINNGCIENLDNIESKKYRDIGRSKNDFAKMSGNPDDVNEIDMNMNMDMNMDMDNNMSETNIGNNMGNNMGVQI